MANYVCSDLHGYLELYKKIKSFIKPEDTVFFLGDAGDRLNGVDGEKQRNMIQLIADYGQSIVNLYRDQVREIEKTVLG